MAPPHSATTTTGVGVRPRIENRAIAAVILGNALEFYDFTTYSFFAVFIGKAFFPAKDELTSLLLSVVTFGIGFVTRPIGGVVIGAYADRAGRKPAMLLTIAMMAIGMLMLAVTPSYQTIGIAAPILVVLGRLVQGFALGGEVGPSTAYLLEASPPSRRGAITSWQLASQGVATLLAGLVGLGLSITLPQASMEEWGWRVPFLLGLAIVPVGLVIRSHLPETAGVESTEATKAESSAWGVVKRLFRDHGGIMVAAMAIIAAGATSNAAGVYMTSYAKTILHMPESTSIAATPILGLTSVVFCLLGGWMADRFGRKIIMIAPRALLALVAYPAYYAMVHHPSMVSIFAATILISALSSVCSTAAIVAIPESFPRAVRSAGLAIAYAVSVSIFGGGAQAFVTWLVKETNDPLSPAYFLVAVTLLGVVAPFFMKETGGCPLVD
jgi:MFS family permease